MPRSDTASPGSASGAPAPDPSAAWVEDHLEAVYRLVRRRLPALEAEDVVQQVFLALFEAQAAGRGPEDPGAYLLGVARRRVADVWRERGRHPPPIPLPDGWEGIAEQVLPSDVLEREEVRDLVHVALGLLPAATREILLDRYRSGLPLEEMARRRGTGVKAIEMRLARARAAFAARYRAVGRDWSRRAEEAGAG